MIINYSTHFAKLIYSLNKVPTKLDIPELANRATNFENEIVGIIASVFESEFEVIVDYDIDKKNCKSIVHYNTNVTVENEGELYNIESSTIFELEIIDGKIKITSITMAG